MYSWTIHLLRCMSRAYILQEHVCSRTCLWTVDCTWAHLSPSKESRNIKCIKQARKGERVMWAWILILKSFGATVLHVWPSKHESRNIWFGQNQGREPQNKRCDWLQFRLFVLGTTLSVNPDCYVRITYLWIERIHLWTRLSPRIPIPC